VEQISSRQRPFINEPIEPPQWLDLWAIGIYDLRLKSEIFWGLTPIEFHALVQRHIIAERRQDSRAALICAVLANIHRDPKRQPFTISDFMPGNKPSSEPQELLEHIRTWNRMMGGKETRRP